MPKRSCPFCHSPLPVNFTGKEAPFCSARCKMLDLGAWASERYRIPIEKEGEAPPSRSEAAEE